VRSVPAQSRVTVRRNGANLVRTTQLADALRESREGLVGIEGQLDALLAALREPGATLDSAAPERLHGAARHVGSVVATLRALARQR
jgi:hypothetical protein